MQYGIGTIKRTIRAGKRGDCMNDRPHAKRQVEKRFRATARDEIAAQLEEDKPLTVTVRKGFSETQRTVSGRERHLWALRRRAAERALEQYWELRHKAQQLLRDLPPEIRDEIDFDNYEGYHQLTDVSEEP